jgi:hypothetical protein
MRNNYILCISSYISNVTSVFSNIMFLIIMQIIKKIGGSRIKTFMYLMKQFYSSKQKECRFEINIWNILPPLMQWMETNRILHHVYRLNAFLEGFYDIIPKRLISIFNEQELELLISGLPNVDIEDLKSNTEYHKYQNTSLQVRIMQLLGMLGLYICML